jgi:hypothetical protein
VQEQHSPQWTNAKAVDIQPRADRKGVQVTLKMKTGAGTPAKSTVTTALTKVWIKK